MKLREAEPLGMNDKHHGGIRYIEANFYYRRTYKDIAFAALEGGHCSFPFRSLHLTMNEAYPEAGKDFFEGLFPDKRGFQIRFLRFLYQGINYVYLPALLHFG